MFKTKSSAVIFLLAIVTLVFAGVTHDQFQQSAKIMRNTCQPKFKVPDELVNKLSQGVFPEDKNLKCFVNCFLEIAQTMKRGKVNVPASLKQIDVLVPEDLKDDYRNALDACKDSAKGIKDNCEAAYAFLKCTHVKNPSYDFPVN
ncbi:general odorant-binding protein 72-like [Phlebotomus argentipes]|uniref:general odorant-binding protein 72-like n=1 Tax=Phlebotomus argentipes TaxID=94469 RepID=UPI002892BC71|nr:general odorant-binding protein 72-like [Phlebotomus argentipes]